jgi:hypothetical protein
MRVLACLLCLELAACSSASESMPRMSYRLPIQPPRLGGSNRPHQKLGLPSRWKFQIRSGRIPPRRRLGSSCLGSGKSEESKRLTYSAFFKKNCVSSCWSAYVDHRGEQVQRPLNH